jgi:hypothetical protein
MRAASLQMCFMHVRSGALDQSSYYNYSAEQIRIRASMPNPYSCNNVC